MIGLPPRRDWSVRLDPPLSGSENMRIDSELLQSAQPCLRLYAWDRPTISLGYGQRLSQQKRHQLEECGLPSVVRPSGGRALLHLPGEITYCIILPQRLAGSIQDNYSVLTGWLAQSLLDLGVPIEIACNQQERSGQGHMGCYALVQQGEILLAGQKLVGSAQRQAGAALLQHGAIPTIVDQHLLERAMPGHIRYQGLTQLGYPIEVEGLLESMLRLLAP